ncbi:hypothetical protein [Desulfovibrio sp. Fe33]|uniref:hypothetical protein n=1 Tax=Desulfovibrio sp. Fe33 TaxID=3020842 RepID=UPI00234DB6AD|nr:hypothetical protein [Desulfovibrio sp. Fe33]
MRAFISFGYYDIREQQLVGSPVILRHLLKDTLRCLEHCPGVRLGGVLRTQELPASLPPGVPELRMTSAERTRAELTAIAGAAGDGDNEVVVIRPAQGAIFADRLAQFCESVRPVPSPLVVSAIRFSSLSHPLWNIRVADSRFHCDGAIRQPRYGTLRVAPLERVCPELWNRAKVKGLAHGSQYLDSLYQDDGALYAARMDMIPADGVVPSPTEAVICQADPGAGDGILARLPLFQMSRRQALDASRLEILLEKLAAAGDEPFRARPAGPASNRLHC